MTTEPVRLSAGAVTLEGTLELPARSSGIVVFSHGSGSSRHSPRNRFVAQALRDGGLGTLLLDLLSVEEDQDYGARFDIDLLTERLALAARFVRAHASTQALPLGLFGASTGAASALRVAAAMPGGVAAVVSRGGRPDLTGEALLRKVKAPTLLIVGGHDHEVIRLNRLAHAALTACTCEMTIVPGATHLFEEPGTLEQVAGLAKQWFLRHLHADKSSAANDPSAR
ncbi:MAG: alpha/beta hydrolase [Betaproteobacteria bacterium]|nr:MAG: alpha/beta hydrolase [Betaproteobacteria bacterium]